MWNIKKSSSIIVFSSTLFFCVWIKNLTEINAALATTFNEIPFKGNRIIGGNSAYISDFPYLMQLHAFNTFICGGTLITARHVVTAAHCVYGLRERELMVIGGTSFLRSMANNSEIFVRRNVSRIIIPKSYRSHSMHMDVAVVRLMEDMKGQNIGILSLCNDTLKANENIQIAGWGLIKEKGNEASLQLRSTHVPLITRAKCQRMYKGQSAISSSMFCASKAGIRDACAGDSGGPAIYHDRLCGIISWGIGCARKSYPGVYTNVKTVKSFIMEAIKQ